MITYSVNADKVWCQNINIDLSNTQVGNGVGASRKTPMINSTA